MISKHWGTGVAAGYCTVPKAPSSVATVISTFEVFKSFWFTDTVLVLP